jgi:glycerol-3-phosphate acyltransferase PlsY
VGVKVLLVALASYLIGCIVGAYYVVRLRTGADVRLSGSGNAGARNVLRSVDRASAAATLVWDVAKGSLAVLLAQQVLPQDWAGGVAFVFVVGGHVWPAQLSFIGGKGAATALGCMIVIDPRATLIALLIGGFVGGLGKSVTAGGLAAIAATPPILALTGTSWSLAAAAAVACATVLIAHHPAFARRSNASAGPIPPRQENVS